MNFFFFKYVKEMEEKLVFSVCLVSVIFVCMIVCICLSLFIFLLILIDFFLRSCMILFGVLFFNRNFIFFKGMLIFLNKLII